MWKKICAIMGAVLAAVLGFFSFIFERQKRKMVEEQLEEHKKALQEKQEQLEKNQNGDKAYATYQKENEYNINRAIAGDFNSSVDILQNATRSGNKRNSK